MAGKKADKPRNIKPGSGNNRIYPKSSWRMASLSQIRLEQERRRKRHLGQYGGAGNPPLIKK
jgi:hypothetical protein